MRKADFELLSADTCKKGMEMPAASNPTPLSWDIMLPGEKGWRPPRPSSRIRDARDPDHHRLRRRFRV
jgi:hypothetical protein